LYGTSDHPYLFCQVCICTFVYVCHHYHHYRLHHHYHHHHHHTNLPWFPYYIENLSLCGRSLWDILNCMYMCIYMYIYIFAYEYTYIWYIYIRIYIILTYYPYRKLLLVWQEPTRHTKLCIYIQIYIYVYVYFHMNMNISVYIHIYIYINRKLLLVWQEPMRHTKLENLADSLVAKFWEGTYNYIFIYIHIYIPSYMQISSAWNLIYFFSFYF
jgi:hypothetical protein